MKTKENKTGDTPWASVIEDDMKTGGDDLVVKLGIPVDVTPQAPPVVTVFPRGLREWS